MKCAQPPTGRGAALPTQHRSGIRGSPQQHQGSALLHHWPEPKSAPGLLTLASMSHLLPSEPPGASCFPFYHLEGQCPLGDSDTPQQDSPVSFYFPPTTPSNPVPTSCPEKMTSPGDTQPESHADSAAHHRQKGSGQDGRTQPSSADSRKTRHLQNSALPLPARPTPAGTGRSPGG